MPSVSVIIPVRNGEKIIARAVHSVLDQSLHPEEVVVVDDGSNDGTLHALEPFGSNVKIISQSNRGPAAARNAGAAVCSGELVSFVDCDDIWMPEMLAKTVAALQQSPDCVLAYTDLVPVDDSDVALGQSMIEAACGHAPSMDEMLTRWWPILTSAVVMKRDTFERCGGFAEAFTAPGYEDPFLWLCAREQGPFQYVAEPLVRYRWTPELDRIEKYADGVPIFARLVHEHFGSSGDRLVREVIRAQVSALGYKGLVALREGDRKLARRAFTCALRYRPLHFRSLMRLTKTFLPRAVAKALTGRTRTPATNTKPAAVR